MIFGVTVCVIIRAVIYRLSNVKLGRKLGTILYAIFGGMLGVVLGVHFSPVNTITAGIFYVIDISIYGTIYGVALYAVVGAIIGAIVGWANNEKDDTKTAGTMIGGIIGVIFGAILGIIGSSRYIEVVRYGIALCAILGIVCGVIYHKTTDQVKFDVVFGAISGIAFGAIFGAIYIGAIFIIGGVETGESVRSGAWFGLVFSGVIGGIIGTLGDDGDAGVIDVEICAIIGGLNGAICGLAFFSSTIYNAILPKFS